MPRYSEAKKNKLKEMHTVCGMLVCGLCNHPIIDGDWNIDHKKPKAHGGTDCIENLQLTHIRCNTRKAARYKMTKAERCVHNIKIGNI